MDTKKSSAERLERAREVQRARLEAGLPRYRNPIDRLAQKPRSRKLAINAKCYDCQGQDADPNVRGRIGNCTQRDCPLWAVRPHQNLYDPHLGTHEEL